LRIDVTAARLRLVFWIDSVYSALTGVLFLLGTWDGLYDALDLPQGQPAVFVQCGGAVLVGVAYLLWLATRTPALMLPVARASALMNALAAGAVIGWLIRGLPNNIGTQGKVELTAVAVLMVVFTLIYLAAGIRKGGYGPESPPTPGG
jgi:hypothetical protein